VRRSKTASSTTLPTSFPDDLPPSKTSRVPNRAIKPIPGNALDLPSPPPPQTHAKGLRSKPNQKEKKNHHAEQNHRDIIATRPESSDTATIPAHFALRRKGGPHQNNDPSKKDDPKNARTRPHRIIAARIRAFTIGTRRTPIRKWNNIDRVISVLILRRKIRIHAITTASPTAFDKDPLKKHQTNGTGHGSRKAY